MTNTIQKRTQAGLTAQVIQPNEVIRIDPLLLDSRGNSLVPDLVAVGSGFKWLQSNANGTFDAQNVSQQAASMPWLAAKLHSIQDGKPPQQTSVGGLGLYPSPTPPINFAETTQLNGIFLVTPTSTTEHPTIESAVASANAGDQIYLGPNTYILTGILNIPPSVAIYGGGANGQALIVGQMVLSENSRIFGVNVSVPPAGVGVRYSGTIFAALQECNFIGMGAGSVGIECSSTTGQLLIDTCGAFGSIDTLLSIKSGRCLATNLFCLLGLVQDFIIAEGGDFSLFESNISALTLCQNALVVGAATVRCYDCEWKEAVNGIFVSADNHNITLRSCQIDPRTGFGGFGFYIDPIVTTGVLDFIGCTIRESTVNITPTYSLNVDAALDFYDPEVGEKEHKYRKNLSIGFADVPSSAAFGYGSSYVRGMTVLQNDNLEIGTWTDITSLVRLPDGLFAPTFAGSAVNNALYVGSDGPFTAFCALFSLMNSPVVLGGGTILLQYWDGAAWLNLNRMNTAAVYPYESFGLSVFERSGEENTRFREPIGWTQKTLDGSSKFWIRFVVDTAPLADVGAIEQFKLVPSSTKINRDGFTEYFGCAEYRQSLLIHQKITDDMPASPANASITFASGLTLTMTDNLFQNAAPLDEIGQLVEIPPNLDTSQTLTVRYGFAPTNNASGVVRFQSRYRIVKAGDLLSAATPSFTVSSDTTIPANSANILFKGEHRIELNGAISGDILVVSLFRDAADPSDTYAGDCALAYFEGFGIAWN